MDDKNTPNNLIQFPGAKRKKAEETGQPSPTTTPPPAPAAKHTQDKKPAAKTSSQTKKVTAGSVLAIILATGAVNKFTFQQHQVETFTASSFSTSTGRSIASVERATLARDADWEKNLAERLAATQPRGVASVGIGHAPTKEEKLRLDTLDQKYTVLFRPDVHNIDSILLQDPAAMPSYILDRSKFLSEYGSLLDKDFSRAKLKSTEVSDGKTIESYIIFDKDNRPKSEARFELDAHKRLLSLKVEPSQI